MPEVGASSFDLPNKGGPGPDMENIVYQQTCNGNGAD